MPLKFNLRSGAVQLLEFEIEGQLMEPEELASLAPPKVDPSKPIVVSGRGPHWLYQFLVHEHHFCRLLATFEPRLGKGIVVESPSAREVGMAVDPATGALSEEKLGVEGRFTVDVLKLSEVQLAYVKVEGSFVEPLAMRDFDWRRLRSEVDSTRPAVFYGLAPIWLGARIAAVLSNVVPWYGVYDPRLACAVVVARHAPDAPPIGSRVRIRTVPEKR
jgi:CRISPR-associated protein Csx3